MYKWMKNVSFTDGFICWSSLVVQTTQTINGEFICTIHTGKTLSTTWYALPCARSIRYCSYLAGICLRRWCAVRWWSTFQQESVVVCIQQYVHCCCCVLWCIHDGTTTGLIFFFLRRRAVSESERTCCFSAAGDGKRGPLFILLLYCSSVPPGTAAVFYAGSTLIAI